MIKMMNKIRQLKTNEDGFTLIEMMIVVAIIAILTAIALPKFNESLAMANTSRVQADLQSLDTAISMYKVQNNKAPQNISDLSEYIDVDNVKAPTGDVYVNGVLTANETGENYSLNSDKTNATFMGKTRVEFGKNSGNE
ncbi:prepilin-type N-terminal cleavage/methylation domain-containing protein [uncultured Megamonas sp.]|uniref:prepilin-type N-terminal cleavage/methylation domain-containing protein n=2 Tax=uncultured Megamonas sp. TaxID=286140 RepID=UPI0025D8E066|nr:prepilin-type N-terminal cleavage/methylation domain-containing protein [uncultured Megamonas sp.]